MKNWQKYRFGDLVDFPPRVQLRKKDEYPFIEMDAIKPTRRFVESPERRKYESSGCSKFINDDVLLARITPCLENGKIAQVKFTNGESSGFGSTEFFVFRGKIGALNQSFLYYISKSDLIWKNAVNSMVGASGRQRADATFLKKVEIRVPKLPVQEKIAAVLSAYDELIENNRRRIALLEKPAEEIYREWFVRLRFPGHDKFKLETRPLRRFISEYVGGDWGEDVPSPKFGNRVYVIRGTDFESIQQGDISSVPVRFIKDSALNNRKLKAGDLIVENSVNHQSRTAGKSLLATQNLLDLFDGDVICASFCKLIRPKDAKHSKFLSLNFRLLFEQGLFDYFQNIATNGIANLQAERFMDRHLIPLHESLDLGIFESLDTSLLARAQAKLKETRDKLLPRLISGKLLVENLTIQFPPGMAEELEPVTATTTPLQRHGKAVK